MTCRVGTIHTTGVIFGFGASGYLVAMEAIKLLIEPHALARK